MRNDTVLVLEKEENLKCSIANILLTHARIVSSDFIDASRNDIDFIVIKDEGQFMKEEIQGIVNYCEKTGSVSIIQADCIRDYLKPDEGNLDIIVTTKEAMEECDKDQLFHMHSTFLYYDDHLSITLEEHLGFGTYYKTNIVTFNQKKAGGNTHLGGDTLCSGLVAGLVCDFTISSSSLLATYLFNINSHVPNGRLPSRDDFVEYLTLKQEVNPQ